MSKLQRVFKRKTVYTVTGPSGLSRELWFVDSMRIGELEHLVFQPLRKVTKVWRRKKVRSLALVKKRA